MSQIFITGGAGFIGKRLSLSLRNAGHSVTVYDNLHRQVHTDPDKTVSQLRVAGVKFIFGDVRDSAALTDAVITSRCHTIVHLASETGTGQSYDLPAHYCDVNVNGTAHVIEAVRAAYKANINVGRVLLAGSRAVYGEGACIDVLGQRVTAVPRLSADLAAGDFSPKDSAGNRLTPIPSRATTTAPAPASIYASTKLMQEYLLLQGFEKSSVEVGILRLQNVYGVGQSLNNPYTGVLSIFAQQLLNGKNLNIYEDGDIVRDFVYVSDVVAAFHSFCEIERVPTDIVDIGTGVGSTIIEIARMMIDKLGLTGNRLQITGEYRPGDIRHAVADISSAQRSLGWTPQISLEMGVGALIDWAKASTP